MTREWDMRLHFETGVEFANARKIVHLGGIEYEMECITNPIPDETPRDKRDTFIRRGTIYLKADDYLKMRGLLQCVLHRIEVLRTVASGSN